MWLPFKQVSTTTLDILDMESNGSLAFTNIWDNEAIRRSNPPDYGIPDPAAEVADAVRRLDNKISSDL